VTLVTILSILDQAWQPIDAKWQKIDIGFRITNILSPVSLKTARRYLETTEELRIIPKLDTNNIVTTYMGCIQLAIRAYSGLLPQNLDTEEDMSSLENAIDYIPSNAERAGLWAKLALHFYTAKRYQDCKRIVSEHVRPLIQGIPKTNSHLRCLTIVNTSPALYCAHIPTAKQFISELQDADRERAYARIGLFLLRKLPLSDPYKPPLSKKYHLTYEDITEIIELLEELETDALIYYFIKNIIDGIDSKKNRFTHEQLNYIKSKLESIIYSKLPDKENIQHQGYIIISQAQAERLANAKSQVWVDLLSKAEGISNLADQAYVLAIVATTMPNREAKRREEAFNEALNVIEQIPFSLDKLQRYTDIASLAINNKNYKFSRKCIDLAQNCSTQNDNPEFYSAKRQLVDLAYIIDEDYATSVAKRLDGDPARAETRYKKRAEVLALGLTANPRTK
jgi:hypothetical protein